MWDAHSPSGDQLLQGAPSSEYWNWQSASPYSAEYRTVGTRLVERIGGRSSNAVTGATPSGSCIVSPSSAAIHTCPPRSIRSSLSTVPRTPSLALNVCSSPPYQRDMALFFSIQTPPYR